MTYGIKIFEGGTLIPGLWIIKGTLVFGIMNLDGFLFRASVIRVFWRGP